MSKRLVVSIVACIVAGALLAGCGEETATVKAPLVKTQQAGAGASADARTYAGTVRGRYETNMSFQVGGQILARNVEVGSRVNAGDVLMVINARDVVQQANAGDAGVASAKAQLDLAQSNLSRYSQLYAESAVSAAVLDQYQTSYDAAFAAYQSALAQAAQGHNALGYTNLVAGASGVVSAINVEEGQVVAAGQTVLTLVQAGELEVEINVPESRVAELSVGAPVTVNFWALKGASSGTVREIAPMADAATRTYRVRVSVPQPPAGLELGMTASVTVDAGGAAAGADGASAPGAILPLSAIYQTGDTPRVWVVGDDNRVTLKSVEVADFGDNTVRVTGLSPTDLVVIAGVHKLSEGQEVRTDSAGSAGGES